VRTGPDDVPADRNRGRRNVLTKAEIARAQAVVGLLPRGPVKRLRALAMAHALGVSVRTVYRAALGGPATCPTCYRPTGAREIRPLTSTGGDSALAYDPDPSRVDEPPISAARMALAVVLADLHDERGNQEAQWGEQSLPDGTGGPGTRELADEARALCKAAAKLGVVTWSDVLLEEVAEAAAEADLDRLREELVQSGAVIVAWIQHIDRRLAS